MKQYSIIVGKYEILEDPNNDEGMVWISAEGAEGGQFRKSDLEHLIAKFFNDNF